MKFLEIQIIEILKRNRDGSHSTQSNRRSILGLCVEDLTKAGYKTQQMKPQDLKGRHINDLLKIWREAGVSEATLKNRMACLRWLAEKVGKKGMIKSNDDLGIGRREYVTNRDKSINLAGVDKAQFSPEIALSVELQQAFGLRREEAMKFMPSYALGGHSPMSADKIMIKPSWSKGGRYREIPVTNQAQRDLLLRVQALAGSGSLIPNDKSYREHKNRFEYETRNAGIGQTHGLRHLYAQNRYHELTGWQCPAVGGVRKLTADEKIKDIEARQQISHELGHNRLSVTGIYLGSWGRQ